MSVITLPEQSQHYDVNDEGDNSILNACHFEAFKMYVNWLSGNQDCDTDFKEEILKRFDLEKFTSEELAFVRQSSLFPDKDVFDALVQINVFLKDKIQTLYNDFRLTQSVKSLEAEKKQFEEKFRNQSKELEAVRRQFTT